MTREEVAAKVRELAAVQPWNHNFDLAGTETRPGPQTSQGKNLVKLERLKPVFDAIGLKGKRVLDIGCNEGFFSLHMAQQGATVIGIDVDEQRLAKARFAQAVLGVSSADFQHVDIYSEAFHRLPPVDLCVCLGVLHRVPDPFSAVSALAEKSDILLFEWKSLTFGPHDDAFAYFSPKPVDRTDIHATEYWLLSFTALERMLQRLGLSHFHRIDDPRQKRAILVAGRYAHDVFLRPDVRAHRGRFRSVLSHTKRYLRIVTGIVSGRVNA